MCISCIRCENFNSKPIDSGVSLLPGDLFCLVFNNTQGKVIGKSYPVISMSTLLRLTSSIFPFSSWFSPGTATS